ncbi:MAG: hypothetical protein WCE38_19015, partial [Burkholderiales bacterium]
AVLAAARARGVEACCRGDLAPYHEAIETALGLGTNEFVVFAAGLGYSDTTPRFTEGRETGPEFVAFSGFD